MDPLAKEALHKCKHKYELQFDQSIIPIKRNLLFVSVLSFAALNVTPKDGEYSVNLGVVSGVIENSSLIFAGLLLVCTYHLYHLWINCRQTALNIRNFGGVEKVYMNELASLYAWREWHTLVQQHTTENLAVRNFIESPSNPQQGGNWKVRSEIETERLSTDIRQTLENSEHFQCSVRSGFTEIDYAYEPKKEDYQFLSIHKDQFWLTKKKEFIEYVFPLFIGFLAIVCLIYKLSM